MSEGKRKGQSQDRPKKRFRSNGTPIWGQRTLDGPGVWVTCVRGKENVAISELTDVFEQLGSELWPEPKISSKGGDDDSDEEQLSLDDIEKAIAKEVASMKKPRKEKRFANCPTNTACVVFISCRPPVDPVKLVTTHIENVMRTGISRTRYVQRLTPVSATCPTNMPEVQSLCTRLLAPILEEYDDKTFTYKIELRIRNHNTLKRIDILQEVAKQVPEKHKVNLEQPEVFILIEIFKSICGISIVKDYYRMQKFNVMEIASSKNEENAFKGSEDRVADIPAQQSVTETT